MNEYNRFISRDGFLMSTEEAEVSLEGARKAFIQEDHEEGLELARKGLSWYQTASGHAADINGTVICYLGEGRSLAQIAEIHTRQGEWKDALRYFQKAREVYAKAARCKEDIECEVDFVPESFESVTLHNIALAYGQLGDYRNSLKMATEASEVFQKIGDTDGQVAALLVAGLSAFYHGDKDAAVSTLKATHELANKSGNREKARIIEEELEGILKES